ncbi:MAG: P44/Msp2 family outer membrane protein [Spirochaetaceae bacterium]|nr:P44/Msp2 family outer membrane protein [Spirochaetaceae bacterium]
MTIRSLHFVLCACLLLVPVGILAAQDMDDGAMKDDGSFSVSAGYGVALPADRKIDDRTISTDLGFVSGRFGVGYTVFGFRPELAVGYRMANVKGQDEQYVTAIDLIAGVYYDIDTGSQVVPYAGIGGGMSYVTVKEGNTKTVWAIAFQGAAGIGYALTEDLSLTLGYRLAGTMDADFADEDGGGALKMALGHNVELGIRYSF